MVASGITGRFIIGVIQIFPVKSYYCSYSPSVFVCAEHGSGLVTYPVNRLMQLPVIH
jgi:hypothetical protein